MHFIERFGWCTIIKFNLICSSLPFFIRIHLVQCCMPVLNYYKITLSHKNFCNLRLGQGELREGPDV